MLIKFYRSRFCFSRNRISKYRIRKLKVFKCYNSFVIIQFEKKFSYFFIKNVLKFFDTHLIILEKRNRLISELSNVLIQFCFCLKKFFKFFHITIPTTIITNKNRYYSYFLLHFKNFSLSFDEILFTIKNFIVNKLRHKCIHEAFGTK